MTSIFMYGEDATTVDTTLIDSKLASLPVYLTQSDSCASLRVSASILRCAAFFRAGLVKPDLETTIVLSMSPKSWCLLCICSIQGASIGLFRSTHSIPMTKG